MFWPDVAGLKAFYTTPLGGLVCRRLRSTIAKCWPEASAAPDHTIVVGLGYAPPYLLPWLGQDHITPLAFMPAAQGVCHWPPENGNDTALICETALPLDAASVDRIILVHALEFTHHAPSMMREMWRALKPGGKLLIIVPNRRGLWARRDTTPFGHGRPFSPHQLEQLLHDTMFSLNHLETTLFLPPSHNKLLLQTSRLIEPVLERIAEPMGGVIFAEAEKQIYANISTAKEEMPGFAPAAN